MSPCKATQLGRGKNARFPRTGWSPRERWGGAPTHRGLPGGLRDPEAVVAAETARQAALWERRRQRVVGLEQQTQRQRVPLAVQEVCEHGRQVRHDAVPCGEGGGRQGSGTGCR